MAEMSKEEFERMQNDAIRRVQNMQQRSRAHVPPMPDYVRPLNRPQFTNEQTGQSPQTELLQNDMTNQHADETPPESITKHPQDSGNKKGFGLGFLDKLNLKNFEIDADRSLVLMMMGLLGRETVDETLMLALLYIML